MSYNAIICKINKIHKHPNADRLQLANIIGYQVIVSLEAKEEDLGIIFPDDGQLSQEYCQANDLIAYKDNDGNRKGGYFDQNRRVRAQKFRGEKSDAYFAPLESLSFTGYDINKLQVGDKFNTLNGFPICNKYINEKTRQGANSKKIKKNKKEKEFTKRFNQHIKNLFPEHFETDQFRHYADKIKSGSLITITNKQHGTSGRISYIPIIKKRNFFSNIFNYIFNGNSPKLEYDYVHGTRRVILTKENDDIFYKTDFRNDVLERFKGKLNKNEIVYFEIVGYCGDNKPIMPIVDTSKLKDKQFTKRFGKTMVYKYGCHNGFCDVYIYRMCVINQDGIIEELSWNRVKQRCEEMGMKYVFEIDHFLLDHTVDLKELVECYTDYMDIADPIDNSHVREGICIRVDDPNGRTKIYKSKTFIFKVLEGIVKDSGVEDMEEVESLLVEEN